MSKNGSLNFHPLPARVSFLPFMALLANLDLEFAPTIPFRRAGPRIKVLMAK